MKQETLKNLKIALHDLPEIQRRAIYLRFWCENTIAEIADYLKISWEKADALIEEALSTLRIKLTPMKIAA